MAWVIQQEGSIYDELYDQLEQVMAEASSLRREAFEESQRRDKAEKDLIDAHRRATAVESAYTEELKQRKEIESELLREKQELEERQNQRDEVIEEFCAELDKLLVTHSSDSEDDSESEICDEMVKKLMVKIAYAVEQMEEYKKERDELQIELDRVESVYNEELKQRKEIEAGLLREKQELEERQNQRDEVIEELCAELDQKSLLESKIAESDEMVKELEVEIISAVEQMEEYQKERDELQIELDRALKVTEDLIQNQADSKGEAPEYFICPILQEVMKDPHVAADGFTYEAEAFREWLDTGHDTSPMTNLQLAHTNLVPNLTLRSGIQEWLQRQ